MVKNKIIEIYKKVMKLPHKLTAYKGWNGVDSYAKFASSDPNEYEYQYVDGVNLKLMKCGGITEALKILNVARSHGLKTMIGCMSESSVSISAGASITGIIDFVDLDSHYNLDPDPSEGSKMVNGITMTSSRLGHGAKLKINNHVKTN